MSIEEEATRDFTPPFEVVLSLCEEFSRAQASGNPPSIASYLERVTEEPRSPLLRNLVEMEVANRRARGEPVRMEDYLLRYPDYSVLIREIFVEAVARSSSFSSETVKPRVAQKALPVNSRLGAYQLLGQLGAGGMGVVYEAVHGPTGNRVALKTLPVLDGAALHRFKREFRSLAGVNHPNIIGLQQLEADGGQWFFTMDLIEGTSYLDYVRPQGVLDMARLRSTLSQLVTAVMALHAQNTIHRDLKPNNVMVTHDGRVVVLDFGLVLEIDPMASMSRSVIGIAGTPRYMAPEQGVAGKVTGASDWYAVGVMLYEALTGLPPFSGNMHRVIQDKNTLDAPPIKSPDAPDDLVDLAMRLLARQPDDRPDAREIVKVIASMPAPSVSIAPGQALVGRETQLASLRETYQAFLQEKEPVAVFIRGRSGEGKTALADRFLAGVRTEKRAILMAGRCYDRESVPFKALDTLIDALGAYLMARPGEEVALLMPDDIGMLVRVFPVLQRVAVVAAAADLRSTNLDETQVRQRAFRALRLLLSRLGRRLPIIWFVDDLQWGDADSAEALFEILRPPEGPTVLFIGTYRSDETDGSAFLAKWKELQQRHSVSFGDREVAVGPLSEDECVQLVVRLSGQDTPSIRQRALEFARDTRGNPFLLTELVGCFDPESDSITAIPLHEVLARKLGRLPDEAGLLLDIISISGQGLPLNDASKAAGHLTVPMATVTRMRNERLIRLIGAEDNPQIDTYHDRVRETILRRMDEGYRRSLHQSFAEMLESAANVDAEKLLAGFEQLEAREDHTPIPRVYDLAYHFDAAGDRRKTLAYSLAGAEQARRQSALEVAWSNYAVAKKNAAEASNAVRYRIAFGTGDALRLLDRYAPAMEALEGCVQLVDSPFLKARVENLHAEVAQKQGDIRKSNEILARGLNRIDGWVPSSHTGLAYGLIRESVRQIAHMSLPFLKHRKPADEQSTLRSRMFFQYASGNIYVNTMRAFWGQLASMNEAELLPPGQELSRAYGFHACMCAMLGRSMRGARYGDKSNLLAKQLNDLHSQGMSLCTYGIGLFAAADYERGLEQLNQAIRYFETAGDQFTLNLAMFHKACCHFGKGEFTEAIATARKTYDLSARIGDSRVLCSSYLLARVHRGNIPFEQLSSCYPCRPNDVMSTAHGTMAEGHWHNFHGRTAEALAAFERARAAIGAAGCWNSHMVLVLPELAGALRRHADTIAAQDPKAAAGLRRRSWRVAKWGARIMQFFPAARPLALREWALILDAYGKTKKALKIATKSCSIAESQKAKYEHARSLLVCGQMAKKLSRPEADETIRKAEAAIEELERPVREMNASGARGKQSLVS